MNKSARVALLAFGSGACALVYQVAWLRLFRLIFGTSTGYLRYGTKLDFYHFAVVETSPTLPGTPASLAG